MLYNKNSTPDLSDELFKNPTCEYRGTPFWAWNNLLTEDELKRQVEVFKEMGLGGFHMHVRTGLKNKYLDDNYLKLVKATVEKAKNEDMLAWLYDEDRWPSGAAGGLVTKDIKYRARNLSFSNYSSDDKKLLACYDVILDENGYLTSYKKISTDTSARGEKWYAYLSVHQPSSWYNDQTYADTLNKEAIEKFIEVTHEKYKEAVGDEFGKTVPAIFTDEPQFSRKRFLLTSIAEENVNVEMPWTDKVPELFKEQYNYDLMDYLPELFWELPNSKPSTPRYHYHDFIAELFAQSFADTVGKWCGDNGISLTGHMMEEPTLHSQTAALGEAMRSYRSFQLPGIDMLCDLHEFTTAKQAQSATHQFGYEGVLSELYGVTGWDCDFRTYKHQGDWQAALGVTVRVPHLSWYAMAGGAKRDYPASISYQSPWYKEFPAVEDHFARVNTALTRGKANVKIGVIHPVESFWLHWGPNDKTECIRTDLNERFLNLTNWILEGGIDFDFISESLFPQLCESAGAPLSVGEMTYDTIVVPGCETLRSTTLQRLEKFREDGGRLIFLGNSPELCDAVESDRGINLYNKSESVEYSQASVLDALESDRLITMRFSNGKLTNNLIYQLRKDNDCQWLFIAHSRYPRNKDVSNPDDVVLTIKGEFIPTLYDTQNGEKYPLDAQYVNGNTVIRRTIHSFDSVLIRLEEGRTENSNTKFSHVDFEGFNRAPNLVEYELDEDNVLLLDQAEYKLDDGEYQPKEEILLLDNICREQIGFRPRGGSIVQPWVYGEQKNEHTITLKFNFNSEIEYEGAALALEDASDAVITFNGEAVSNEIIGNFVDISIYKVALPKIKKGNNELIITIPFGITTNTENVFILGKFGVKVIGSEAEIIEMPEKIPFGNITNYGFPFYGASVTYKFDAKAVDGKLTVHASDYRGGLICVNIDGQRKGNIIYPPYELTVNNLTDGKHSVELKLCTHRYNTFGPVHMVDVTELWQGPNAWRSVNDDWSYEYALRPAGILKAPLYK